MPPKRTTWDRQTLRHVLVIVGADGKASRIEVGYDMGDMGDPSAQRRETQSLLPPGPRFATSDTLIAELQVGVKAQEGL